jgi:hypothetical protein
MQIDNSRSHIYDGNFTMGRIVKVLANLGLHALSLRKLNRLRYLDMT